MSDRKIVASDGRYVLEGTRYQVAGPWAFAHEGASDEEVMTEEYPQFNLTAGEMAAIRAFTWPPITDAGTATIDQWSSGVDVVCRCGEPIYEQRAEDGAWVCFNCRREYRSQLTLTEITKEATR